MNHSQYADCGAKPGVSDSPARVGSQPDITGVAVIVSMGAVRKTPSAFSML